MLKQIVFAVLLTAAMAMFAWTLRRFAKMLLAGRAEKRTDHIETRVDSLLSFFFGQRKVIEEVDIPAARWPRFSNVMGSRHHFIIFWGFLVICLGTLETFAHLLKLNSNRPTLPALGLPAGGRLGANRCPYDSTGLTTSPATSVRRKSRPWNR